MVSTKHSENVGNLQADHTVVEVTLAPREQSFPFVSVVVACKTIDSYVKECAQESLRLEYPSFEVLLLPDYDSDFQETGVRVLPTGPIPPSEKRNIGVKSSKGDIVAFIDGDAYPARDWLGNAAKHFLSLRVAAVGGPGLTPESDDVMQKASGEILSSLIGGGPLSFRHRPKGPRGTDDLPSVNLIVRKSVFNELGGFNSSYWPGEDTKFCRDIVYGLKMDILYAPDVRVFHHRRELFRPHLKQIAGYGFHRGLFSKKFPENSRRPLYFLPSVLALGLPIIILLGYLRPALMPLSISVTAAYFLIVLISALGVGLKHKDVVVGAAFFVGAIATHLWYGAYFIKGLLSRGVDTHTRRVTNLI